MHCEECGTEAKSDELVCPSCGGRLTQADLDLPEVAPFPIKALEHGRLGLTGTTAEATGPRLEVRVGNLAGSFPVSGPVMTIGRRDPAENIHPDVDLAADDAVSRRHAELRVRNGVLHLVDVGSTNGTLVNGDSLEAGEERALSDGDVIQMGERCVLTLRL